MQLYSRIGYRRIRREVGGYCQTAYIDEGAYSVRRLVTGTLTGSSWKTWEGIIVGGGIPYLYNTHHFPG